MLGGLVRECCQCMSDGFFPLEDRRSHSGYHGEAVDCLGALWERLALLVVREPCVS
jgi:hypothetical protein